MNIRTPEIPVPADEPCQPVTPKGPGPKSGGGGPPRHLNAPVLPTFPVTPMSGGDLLQPNQEGRLIDPLRQVAQLRKKSSGGGDAVGILTKAAVELVKQGQQGIRFALALADLAVSGRAAYADFCSIQPQDRLIQDAVTALGDPAIPALASRIGPAVTTVLDRAYKVAWFLRGQAARADLGWIAVSGEDDLPHRPVNVPGTKFPQYDLGFNVVGPLGPIPVTTRFTIATASQPADPPVLTTPPRTCPPVVHPTLPTDPIILYIHGSDSRLEEASDLIPHLVANGFSVISMDLPGSGYANQIDHTRIGTWEPGWVYIKPTALISLARANMALLPFLKQFIYAFVETLSLQLGRSGLVESRIAAVMGGSLGGNLGLWLAGPSDPWPRNVVAYSAGSVWNAMDDVQMQIGLLDPLHLVDLTQRIGQTELQGSRADFFAVAFDRNIPWQTQPQQWYRDSWPCKPGYINFARSDRQEQYTQESRRWHWRISFEEVAWTWRDPMLVLGFANALNFASKRLLLGAGTDDNNDPVHIYTSTLALAQDIEKYQLQNPPPAPLSPLDGDTFFLSTTGHSIHAERPAALAAKVAEFVPITTTPTINVDGTVHVDPGAVNVDITATTPNATIYYTVNGADPDLKSPHFAGEFQLTSFGPAIVRAFALAPGHSPSPIASADVADPSPPLPQVATPTINVDGTFSLQAMYVDIAVDATFTGTIYYTTDGSDPKPNSGTTSAYGGGEFPVTISVGRSFVTVKAIAVAPGYRDSAIGSTDVYPPR